MRHEITFNAIHLDCPFAEQLDTLLHELLHEWQEMHGKPPKKSKYYNNYHNRQFREKAFYYGLAVDERGCSLGVVPGPFAELLEEKGVDTSCLHLPPRFGENGYAHRDKNTSVKARGNSKMQKWSCHCSPKKNIRAAVELNVLCKDCDEMFERAKSSW